MKIEPQNDATLRQVFNKWRHFVSDKTDKTPVSTEEKIENFLKALKHKKFEQTKPSVPLVAKSEPATQVKSHEPPNGLLKFRFEAQKNIIEYQKDKLKQQEILIQDLKLNKIVEDLKCSTKEAETLIRTIFKDRPHKTKHLIKATDEDVRKFEIKTMQIPTVIREIDKRAIERTQKRKLILERKRLNDENYRKHVESEIKIKHTLEENERKVMIEKMIKLRRRKLHFMQQIRIREEKETENNEKAVHFYRMYLKKLTISRFKQLVMVKQHNFTLSFQHYNAKLVTNCWEKWFRRVSQIAYEKNRKAEQLYTTKLTRRVLISWYKNYATCRQNLQVAKDLYDFKLQTKCFFTWFNFSKTMQTIKIQRAQQHYNTQTLLNFYYRWKLLPFVMRLERKKESKKQRWRNKVREVLYDYEPISIMEESY